MLGEKNKTISRVKSQNGSSLMTAINFTRFPSILNEHSAFLKYIFHVDLQTHIADTPGYGTLFRCRRRLVGLTLYTWRKTGSDVRLYCNLTKLVTKMFNVRTKLTHRDPWCGSYRWHSYPPLCPRPTAQPHSTGFEQNGKHYPDFLRYKTLWPVTEAIFSIASISEWDISGSWRKCSWCDVSFNLLKPHYKHRHN